MVDSGQSRAHPSSLTTLHDILDSLSSLEDEENALERSLASALADAEPVQSSLSTLRSLAPRLDEISAESKLLSQNVSATAVTADRVGGRVRALDEEMKRIKEAADRVSQVMELKSSLADLQSAIDSHNWETATRHCARAMAIPLEVIAGPFAESAVPTADLPLPPVQTLQGFREQLRDIFLQQFSQASNARDSNSTTRFFKLLPPIGWEKEGLETYASFVVTLVQSKSPASVKSSSPLYYVTALTALFESVCSILDQHQSVVEKYYGRGNMQIVVEHLVRECDNVVKRLLDGWEDDRAVRRMITESARANSVAMTSPIGRKPGTQPNAIEENTTDPRDVDKVLNELSAMTMRFSAFRRFLYAYLQNNEEGKTPSPSSDSIHNSVEPSSAFEVIEASLSKAMFRDFGRRYYIPLEVWYLRSTVHQAHKTSTTDDSHAPPMTTVPDLVFYILKSILYRLLSTGSVEATEDAIKQMREVLEKDYAGIIKHKLDDVYKIPAVALTTARPDKLEKDSKFNFIVLLNDLDVSATHLDRLIRELNTPYLLSQNFLPAEMDAVYSALTSLLSVTVRFRSTMKGGIDQLFNQLIRPRLRNMIPEVYRDVSYELDEDGFTSAQYQDVVRKRFIKAWENMLDDFKESFTESNYRTFIGQVLDVLIRPWEKYVMSQKYTELGAIRFDQDVRAVTAYLSSNAALGDIRERFQRLQQISTLLNIDKDEDVEDFYSSSGIAWRITLAEARDLAKRKV